MINVFYQLKELFSQSISEIANENNIEIEHEKLQSFTIEPSKDEKHGDFACNAAMTLFKSFSGKIANNPRELAQKIIEKLENDRQKSDNFYLSHIKKLEIAGAGFINIFVENAVYHQVLENLLYNGKFTFPDIGKGEKINLEYASPNPTGPIHVGHCRGAIYGDVLASLLQKCGYDVLKEYYINDAGSQIKTLVKSAYLRYLEACGEKIEIPEGLYPGEYLIAIGEKIHEKYGDELKNNIGVDISNLNESQEKQLEKIRDFVVEKMVNLIIEDLQALGIKHDSYFSEKRELHDSKKIDEAIQVLRDKGLIYEGKLEAPKTEKGVGALPEGYCAEDQTLFKSTLFGDDQDRVVKKSDGTPTYLAGDMAYALSKFERGAKKFIMPLGFDHSGYVKRLNAVVKALTNDEAKLKVILCQMVKFVKNGEPLKMSKRAGNFITAREVIDEVGSDALRFIMLTRKNDAPFDFDLNKVIEQSKDNPIFYVQYAHTRCCSIIRNLKEQGFQGILDKEPDLNLFALLNDESEIEIMKKIISFSRLVEMAAINYEPHRIAFYLQELSALFHSLWNKGSENKELKFIIADNKEITEARIYLVLLVQLIIKTGLDIFNIKAIEEMR